MNEIFKNAYFGKLYMTRDLRKALFCNCHNSFAREGAKYVTLIIEGEESTRRYSYDGTAHDHQENIEIVSEL